MRLPLPIQRTIWTPESLSSQKKLLDTLDAWKILHQTDRYILSTMRHCICTNCIQYPGILVSYSILLKPYRGFFHPFNGCIGDAPPREISQALPCWNLTWSLLPICVRYKCIYRVTYIHIYNIYVHIMYIYIHVTIRIMMMMMTTRTTTPQWGQ